MQRSWYEKLTSRIEETPPFVTLVISLSLTVGLTILAFKDVLADNIQRFDRHSSQVSQQVDHRINEYLNALLHTRAFFSSSAQVTREEFHAYFKSLDFASRYPGVLGLGYALRIRPDDVSRHIKDMRRSGFSHYQVWPEYPRSEYFSIIYLEPFHTRNQRAFGYDMFTDPVRHEAMVHARDTGLPTLTRRVTLVQETSTDTQPGLLIYAPIYRVGTSPKTLEERREALQGFIYSPIRTYDFFDTFDRIKEAEEAGCDIEIYADDSPSTDTLIYASDPSTAGQSLPFGGLRFVSKKGIGGNQWTIVVSVRPSHLFEGIADAPLYIFIGGFVVTALLFRWSLSYLRYSRDLLRNQEELRKQVSENARLYHEAQGLNRAKDEFLANLSHELRTPLNVIQGHAELLMEESIGNPEIEESISAIFRNSRIQTQIVNDLLDVSSIVTGKITMNPEPVDLREVIVAAIESVRFSAENKQISIESDLGTPTLPVMGDPVRLQQVFWNLLSNSVKFTPSLGRISILCERRDPMVRVRIRDTGKGIAPQFLPHVFERFRQEDGTRTRQFGGLGLGLSIVRNLVELHHGSVRVQSEGVDKGSEFTVSLPLYREK